MATWRETYVNLAIALDATLSDPTEDYKHLLEARLALIDLTSIDDGSLPGYGTEAEVALLTQMDFLVRQAKHFPLYDTYRNLMVESINDFTIKYFGDLDDFVNSLDWPDLCVPFYWAELTENGNIDTSNWTVCS
jgi:hypothetical protein